MSRGKRVLIWALILLVAGGVGFGVAALTYHPPDPELDRVPVPASSAASPTTPVPSPSLVTVAPGRDYGDR